jgi:hypothetical protein
MATAVFKFINQRCSSEGGVVTMSMFDCLLDQLRDMSTLITKKKATKKVVIEENDVLRMNDDDFFGRGIETILGNLRQIPITSEQDIINQLSSYQDKRRVVFQ